MSASFAVSRRLVLAGLALAALPAAPAAAREGATRILSIADLHSAYGRLPQLLALMRSEAAGAGDVLIVLNGDLFELANPVATRSRGEADMAFLAALAGIAPVIVNIGNHEPDFVDDMADIVAMMEAAGATVISNIVDPRSGRLYAPVLTRAAIAGADAVVAGIATDNLFTYPEAIRPQLAIPAPVDYAEALIGRLSEAPVLLLSHAGVVADKAILPLLPEGSVAVGGHNHITLTHDGPAFYAHGGAWGRLLTRLDVTRGAAGLEVAAERIEVPARGEGDAGLAALIAALEAEHLAEEDLAVVGTSPREMGLREAILFAAEAVRARAGADLAVLGHTTFGTGLPEGPVRAYDFDAYIRFDGDIRVAEVEGATLRGILALANQHEAASLDERTGDFVHAAAFEIDDAATYRLATNGWTATNQGRYLGTEDLRFAPVEGLTLKAAVGDAMR
jgi:2',3'-cyclic-nucleotide 2'-phosphodiesterase (5'-nucleotidase family)